MLHRTVGAVAIVLAIAVSGCGDRAAPLAEIAVTEADSDGVRVVTLRGPVEALPEWSLSDTPITEISGGAAPFIGSVGTAVFFGAEDLVVYDRQSAELRWFGGDGQEVGLLAEAGDGPGEFRALEQLTVTEGDTIYAFDRRHNRMTVFNPDGSFRASAAIDPQLAGTGASIRHAWALDSDQYLVDAVTLGEAKPTSGAPVRVSRGGIIQIGSADGAKHGAAVRFAGGFGVRGALGEVGSPFSTRPFVAVGSGRILHSSGLTYELHLRDFALRPVAVIRWLGWQRSLSRSFVEELRGPMAASLSELRAVNPDAAEQLIDDLMDPRALPEFLPELGTALLAEDGHMWVSRFRPTEDLRVATTGGYEPWDQVDVWHVLDPRGLPIARVKLPPETRLLAVRRDRVMVVSRDDLGVEYVRVLQIKRDVKQ